MPEQVCDNGPRQRASWQPKNPTSVQETWSSGVPNCPRCFETKLCWETPPNSYWCCLSHADWFQSPDWVLALCCFAFSLSVQLFTIHWTIWKQTGIGHQLQRGLGTIPMPHQTDNCGITTTDDSLTKQVCLTAILVLLNQTVTLKTPIGNFKVPSSHMWMVHQSAKQLKWRKSLLQSWQKEETFNWYLASKPDQPPTGQGGSLMSAIHLFLHPKPQTQARSNPKIPLWSLMMMAALASPFAPRHTSCVESRNVKARSLTVTLSTNHTRLSAMMGMKKNHGMQKFNPTSTHLNPTNKERNTISIGSSLNQHPLNLMKMFMERMWLNHALMQLQLESKPILLVMMHTETWLASCREIKCQKVTQ